MLVFLLSVVIASTTATLLRCSEQSFDAFGGVLPSGLSKSKYSICSDGVVHEIACPHGDHFDSASQKCITSHEFEQQAVMESYFEFEELCTNPNEVQFLPNPTNCTQYIICYGLVAIQQSCEYGLLFNPELGLCDIPSNVVCGYSCPRVDDPENPVWLPDARLEDCSRHYLCFQGNPIQFFCQNNLYFDVISNTCTYPQYSACSIPGVYCDALRTENIENPRSCTSYYTCLEGFPHFKSCANDEYFSTEMGRCVVGSCPPQVETTTQPLPTTPTGITSTIDLNTSTTSFTSTTDISTSTTSFTSTVISTEQSTTELSSNPTLSTPIITSTEITTEFPTPTMTTPGGETTPAVTTVDAGSTTVEVLSTTLDTTLDSTVSSTEASTTTTESGSTSDVSITTTEDGTTASTSEIPLTTGDVTSTEFISTTVSVPTITLPSTTESGSTIEVTISTTTEDPFTTVVTPTIESSTATEVGTTPEITISTTTEDPTTTETTFTTEVTPTVESSTATDAGTTAEVTISTTTEDPTTTETTFTTEVTPTVESSTTTEVGTTPEVTISTTTEDPTTTEASTTETTFTTEVTPTVESSTATEVGTTPEVTISTTTEDPTTTEASTTETTFTTEETPTVESSTTTEAEITTTTLPTTTIDPSEFCQGSGNGAFPYPGNCYQYILCLNGSGIISECAENQIFNATQRVCVPGDRSTCSFL
ncbi:mucin-2-like [Anopheles ziemanni]|uniref:mucin-2-like n=1 Tax=Anopheles coustani TaxID=139045 RepID=UPI00265A5CBC|nr:mucin-2-like [Anopheles coustani]XP_058170489.1 mucin-2-like [Anopheles ziemanni]